MVPFGPKSWQANLCELELGPDHSYQYRRYANLDHRRAIDNDTAATFMKNFPLLDWGKSWGSDPVAWLGDIRLPLAQ